MYLMYPLGLEAEAVATEYALRLERARHEALLSEARRAQRRQRGPHMHCWSVVGPLRQATAAALRGTSAVLAALADAVERPLIGQDLERAG
jgi:hypothetical protein